MNFSGGAFFKFLGVQELMGRIDKRECSIFFSNRQCNLFDRKAVSCALKTLKVLFYRNHKW